MATLTVTGSLCATCGKTGGTFIRRRYSKDFCLCHKNKYHEELSRQLDGGITPLHHTQPKRPHQHPLIQRVDEWEQSSIEKIHQAANDARKQLLDIVKKHNTEMKKSLEQLTQQMKTLRDNTQLFETDRKEWMKKLIALKKKLSTPQTIDVQYDTNPTSFISKIFIRQNVETFDEYFEQTIGNIQITNNRTAIVHNRRNSYASVRGRCDYFMGEHRVRFRIENLSANKWIFFGVVSKTASTLVSTAPSRTCYGFSGHNLIWRNGVSVRMVDGYQSDFKINDTIELIINCDQRKLSLKNERTGKIDHLDIDITKCPSPWKLCVGMHYLPGERIQILNNIFFAHMLLETYREKTKSSVSLFFLLLNIDICSFLKSS